MGEIVPKRKVIKSREHAQIFLNSIPHSTLRNLIALVLCAPRNSLQLARVLGCSVCHAERLIRKFAERGIIESIKYKMWIILDIDENIKAEITDGISAIVNFFKDHHDIPEEQTLKLLMEILQLKGKPKIKLSGEIGVPSWADHIYKELIKIMQKRRKELREEKVIFAS